MKISELNTNTFLNNSGSPENSYLLINYAATQGAAATTQKTSLDTVGKAIAAKLNLPIAVTDSSGNVTGLQRVKATGNSYQIENLNAQFGGGGASNFGPLSIENLSWADNTPGYAYPVYYIPVNSSGEGSTIENSTNGFYALLTLDENDQNVVLAYNENSAGEYTLPSMGGGDDTGGGNGSGNGS